MKGGGKAVVIVGVALVMASGARHGHGHSGGFLTALSSAPIPAGGSYTPRSFAKVILRVEGDRRTRCSVSALVAWEGAEGGHWANDAEHNPLNSTLREPGSWPINSAGVQAYPDWHTGIAATVTTLNLPAYWRIRSALAAGEDAQAVADAVAASPWGTGPFTASC